MIPSNGVTQYIGARYVPKFYENSDGTSEWRSGVIYEPLTIVTWNGNSYTSKKPVPAEIGDPSAYPEYWAATGNFNEQIQELMQKFDYFPFVTPEDYGAVGDGETDDTAAFAAALAVAARTGRILISYKDKTYLITNNITFARGVTVDLGGRLLGSGAVTATIEELADVRHVIFDKINVVCNGYHTTFADNTIRNVSGTGLSIEYLTGGQGEENTGRYAIENVLVDNWSIENRNNEAVGIAISCPDTNITNCEVINCRTAYRIAARSCKLTGCTAWINAYMSDVFDDTVCYDVRTTGPVLIGCTCDSYALAIKMPGTYYGLCLEGFRVINNNQIFRNRTFTFINYYGIYIGDVLIDLVGFAANGNQYNLGSAGHLEIRQLDGDFSDCRWNIPKGDFSLSGVDAGGVNEAQIRRNPAGYIVNMAIWSNVPHGNDITINHSGLPVIDQAGMDGYYIVPAVYSDGTNKMSGNATVTIADGVFTIHAAQIPQGAIRWSDVFFNMTIPLKPGSLT